MGLRTPQLALCCLCLNECAPHYALASCGRLLAVCGPCDLLEEPRARVATQRRSQAAAVALAAVEAFFGAGAQRQLDVDTVRAGFAAAISPGRLERMRSAPTVFIDAAHNPDGAEALASTLATDFDFRYLVGVLSVMGDKDVTGILTIMFGARELNSTACSTSRSVSRYRRGSVWMDSRPLTP